MSKKCYICGKGSLNGKRRSDSLNSSKRRFKPNLVKVKADLDGKVKKIKVCMSCLKAGKVTKVY